MNSKEDILTIKEKIYNMLIKLHFTNVLNIMIGLVKLPIREDSHICSYVMIDICCTLKKVPSDSEVALRRVKTCDYTVGNHRANELCEPPYLPRSR